MDIQLAGAHEYQLHQYEQYQRHSNGDRFWNHYGQRERRHADKLYFYVYSISGKDSEFCDRGTLVVAVDMQRGQQYLLECTAHWRGSQCHGLLNGYFNAFIENDTVTVNARRRGKNVDVKYHILQAIAGTPPTSVSFVPEITAERVDAMWHIYLKLSDEDKRSVQSFCMANQNLIAFTPQDKVKAGQEAEHALDCTNLNRARKVYEQ